MMDGVANRGRCKGGPCRNPHPGLITERHPCRNPHPGLTTDKHPCRNPHLGLTEDKHTCRNPHPVCDTLGTPLIVMTGEGCHPSTTDKHPCCNPHPVCDTFGAPLIVATAQQKRKLLMMWLLLSCPCLQKSNKIEIQKQQKRTPQKTNLL